VAYKALLIRWCCIGDRRFFISGRNTWTNIKHICRVDQHTRFLGDYFSFLKIEALLPVPEKPTPIPDGPVDNISFENINFHYPGGHGEAIENLNLNIRRGELIALVGENGAGKSTLVKLLLRFYDVQKGSIKIGGIDVKDMDPETLRSRIGILFQDYATYELSSKRKCNDGLALW
jgi:ABC-type multidrug transport system fused ATPase/permease subunit